MIPGESEKWEKRTFSWKMGKLREMWRFAFLCVTFFKLSHFLFRLMGISFPILHDFTFSQIKVTFFSVCIFQSPHFSTIPVFQNFHSQNSISKVWKNCQPKLFPSLNDLNFVLPKLCTLYNFFTCFGVVKLMP